MPDRRPVWLLLLLLIMALVAGCSRVGLAYNTADFVIELYASDYLALDARQVAAWRPTLHAALARHRSEELPYLAGFFAQAAEQVRAGFAAEDLNCLFDQAEEIYRRQMSQILAAVLPLLEGLTPAQIDALERRFAEQARADATDDTPAGAVKRQRKRAERYIENLEWFMGTLDARQRALVTRMAQAMPDVAAQWYAYRDERRQELLQRLRRPPGEERGLEPFLRAWLIDWQEPPLALARARLALRQGWIDLLLALDPMLAPAQRTQFVTRLTGLRDDFMALQQRPRTLSLGCRAPAPI